MQHLLKTQEKVDRNTKRLREVVKHTRFSHYLLKNVMFSWTFSAGGRGTAKPKQIWSDFFRPYPFSGQIFFWPDFSWPDFSGRISSGKILFPARCFLTGIFRPDVSGRIISGSIFVGLAFRVGGRGRKITPLVSPLIFEHFFGHETGRCGSYWINSEKNRSKSQADADFEVKSAVPSYFWIVFKTFLS